MKKYDKMRKKDKIIIIPLLFGTLFGSLFYLNCKNHFFHFEMESYLEEYTVTGIMELPGLKLFLYVIQQRAMQILLFMLFVLLFSFSLASCIYLFIFGFYYGIIMEHYLILYGLKGFSYGFFCFFPHYFIYFLVLYVIGKWIYPSEKNIKASYITINSLQKIMLIVWIVFLLGVGLIWEIKFQKNILNYFYQYLV